ncbi:hypothetical protein [Flagellimonas halotolerans]|uniref:hypothetical protein n=1 Tax=Flagellimonas halotolerans TaxID=3112164 RepID=UPI003D1875CF
MNFKQLMEKLPDNQFLRGHPSFVVKLVCITAVQRNKIHHRRHPNIHWEAL